MRQLKAIFQWLIITTSVSLLISCTSIGTVILPKNRAGYNDAMIFSEEQQLLLNIVRLRFDDRPYFISVDSITSSNTLSFSGGASYNYSPNQGGSSSNSFSGTPDEGITSISSSLSRSFGLSTPVSANANSSYSDSPTISLAPLQGEKFTMEMLTPVNTEVVYTMLEAGFDIQRLFRILFYKFGDYHNISSMTLPGPPDFQDVIEILKILEELQQERAIYFQENVITHISTKALATPKKEHKSLDKLKEKYHETREYEDEKE